MTIRSVSILIIMMLITGVGYAADDAGLTMDAMVKGITTKSLDKDGKLKSAFTARLKNLSADDKTELLAKLMPVLGNLGGTAGRGRYALDAFAAIGAPAVEPVVAALAGDGTWRDAENVLRRLPGAAVTQLANAVLSDLPATHRKRVLHVLRGGSFNDHAETLRPVLLEVLSGDDKTLHGSAAQALARFGVPTRAERETLLALAASNSDVLAQQFAIRTLGNSAPLAADEVQLLMGLLANESLNTRAITVGALGKANVSAAAPALDRLLVDVSEDLYLRERAMHALVALGEVAVPLLTAHLGDADRWSAYYSARALAAIGAPGIASLREVLTAPAATPQQLRYALYAVAQLGTAGSDLTDTAKTHLAHADASVRRNAVEAMAMTAGMPAIATIQPLLEDADPAVAEAAAAMIQRLHAKEPAAADTLLAAYNAAHTWKPTGEEAARYQYPADMSAYEIGGPLAGVKLPLWQGQHGEEPGYPGSIPELIAEGKVIEDMGNVYVEWGPQGQHPELELYEGSVEHWRSGYHKYLPIRSFYDRQSQLKRWTAPALPGLEAAEQVDYAEPVYWVPRHADPTPTGRFREPVPTRRMTVDGPTLKLDLGTLDVGFYALRVVGTVDRQVGRFTEPLFMRMTVNDQLDGGSRTYRKRCGYVDQFYCIQIFYFHATERREFQAEIAVDQGSTISPLIQTISLDDALTGTVRQPLKTRPMVASQPPRIDRSRLALSEDRLTADAQLWRGLPSANAQGSAGSWSSMGHYQRKEDVTRFGADGMSSAQIEAEYGSWRVSSMGDGLVFLHNGELGLVYTMDMLNAGEPLPAPYPFADSGAGLYDPDDANPNKGQAWVPVATQVQARRSSYGKDYVRDAKAWESKGDADAARRAAITLARIAYQVPSIETRDLLEFSANMPSAIGEGLMRRQTTQAAWLSWYTNYLEPLRAYDQLYTYIDGNEELAASIGQSVPWVKTSKDVIQLLDVYLVQTVVKRILRYHYYVDPMAAADAALLLGNQDVASIWLDMVFKRTFVYPLPTAGIQDLMISGTDRSGAEFVASTYYAAGEGAQRVAASLDRFKKAGMLPQQYDLSDTAKYPKPLAHCYWHLSVVVAGQEFLRIGDVTGADKGPGHTMHYGDTAANGWKWSKDPKFAWLLLNLVGRGDRSDAEWDEIRAAAATCKRAPWLDLPSRQVYNWAGILETGFEHDDWRYRRAVYVRTGLGIGHHHEDSLDLNVVAHGLPMTMDGGQRPGYSTPGDRMSRLHNVVEVDNRNHRGQSWVTAITDAPGARSMHIDAVPPENTTYYNRQVALVDVDEGEGSAPLDAKLQLPGAKLPANPKTGNSYVVDVFRVAGGTTHTYAFHAMVNDELETNIPDLKPVTEPAEGQEPSAEWSYLRPFSRAPEQRAAGTLPETLVATWRYSRGNHHGSEQSMSGGNFDAASPRKYTRLHLMDVAGLTGMRGRYVSHARSYWLDNIYAQRRATDDQPIETAFAAVIETYAGTPFVTSTQLLPVADNESDARRAVAVRVETVNGHTDVTYMDGRPEKTRTVGDLVVAGESAFYGVDAEGLRVATLTGGTVLKTPEVDIMLPRAEWTGSVTAVDYEARAMTIDGDWTGTSVAGSILEIGTERRMTSYTLTDAKPGAASTLVVQGGADFLRSPIASVDTATGIVTCPLVPTMRKAPGLDLDFTAATDDGSKTWTADYLGEGRWQLSGAPVSAADFQPSGALRIWEYGVGDRVRMASTAWITRVTPGTYEIGGNCDFTVALQARSAAVSTDGGTTWSPIAGQGEGKRTFAMPASARAGKTCLLRLAAD